MHCNTCVMWITRRVTRYENGAEIERYRAPDGKGECGLLKIETPEAFGCISHGEVLDDSSHKIVEHKTGAPWNHFVMIPCPDCNGKGDGGRGHRCAGTGLVRLYDDGEIGDEQTRLHSAEKAMAEPPKCPGCGGAIDLNWKHCPVCGSKVWSVAETEIVESGL